VTDKSKKGRNGGTGWKTVTGQDNWNMPKQRFHIEIGAVNGFYMMKNRNLKNSIDRIHLYLILYGLHKEIQKYLAL